MIMKNDNDDENNENEYVNDNLSSIDIDEGIRTVFVSYIYIFL